VRAQLLCENSALVLIDLSYRSRYSKGTVPLPVCSLARVTRVITIYCSAARCCLPLRCHSCFLLIALVFDVVVLLSAVLSLVLFPVECPLLSR